MWRAGIAQLVVAAVAIVIGGPLTVVNATLDRPPELAWTSIGVPLLMLAVPILLSGAAYTAWGPWGRSSESGDATAAMLIIVIATVIFIAGSLAIIDINLRNALSF